MTINPRNIHRLILFITVFIFISKILYNENSLMFQSAAAKPINLNTNSSYRAVQLDTLQSKDFKYTKFKLDQHFVLVAFPTQIDNEIGNAIIYFGANSSNLTNQGSCQLVSSYQTCFQPNGTYTNDTIYFTISCQHGPCSFQLSAYQQSPLQLSSAFPKLSLTFTNQIVQVLTIRIPDYNSYRKVILAAQFMNRRGGQVNTSTIQFNQTVSRVYLQGDRYTAVFYSPNKDLNPLTNTTGQDVVVTIISDQNSTVELSYYLYTLNVANLQPNNAYIDYILPKIPNIYSLTFEDSQSYDYIKVAMKFFEAQSSQVDMQVHGDTLPNKARLYYWQAQFYPSVLEDDDDDSNSTDNKGASNDTSTSIEQIEKEILINKEYNLIITREQVNLQKFQGRQFYIRIWSQVASPYYLEFQAFKQDNKLLSLDLNEIVGSILIPQQQMKFLLRTISPKDYNFLVTLDLKSISGNADLYVYPCLLTASNNSDTQALQSCQSIQLAEGNNNPDGTTQVHIAKSTETTPLESITFHPVCQGGIRSENRPSFIDMFPLPSKVQICSYIISVVAQDPINQTQFLLQSTTEYGKQQILVENQAFDNLITSGEYQYYVFYLNQPTNVTNLRFRISSAHTQIYVSNNDNCQLANDTCSNFRGIMSSPISLVKKNAHQSVYYVGVFSYVHTDYTLTVEVTRKDIVSKIKLKDAQPYVSEITAKNRISYFYYYASLSPGESIEINLRGPKNKLIVLVNPDKSIPDPQVAESFTWISRSGFLLINYTDPDYKKIGTYTIAIAASDSAFASSPVLPSGQPSFNYDEDLQRSLQFKLMVSTSSSIKTIELNEPFFDVVLPLQMKYYEVHVDPLKQIVLINRDILVGDNTALKDNINFYIGSEPFQKPKKFEFKLKGGDNATFELNQGNLLRLCDITPDDFNDEQNSEDNSTSNNQSLKTQPLQCPVFLVVDNNGGDRVAYTLTVWERNLAIELKEGQQHTYTLYYVDEYMNFYYIPTHQDVSINFYMYSFYGRTNFNINIYDNSKKLLSRDWPFPLSDTTTSSYNYSSGIHGSHSFTLQPNNLQGCWPNCVMLISVIFFEEDSYDEEKAQQSSDIFTLLTSTLYSDIQVGSRIEFSLSDDESKYFFVDQIPQMLQDKNSIILTLTSLSGRAALAASLRDDYNTRYPLHNIKSDFISYTGFLQISPKEIKRVIKKAKLSLEANLNLVVEVYAFGSSGKFVLSLLTSDSPTADLLHGVPHGFIVTPQQDQVFRYFNYFKSDIEFRLHREFGFGDLMVYSCSDASDNSTQNCLQGNPDSLIHIAGSSSLILIDQSSDLFCIYCYYMIKVHTDADQQMQGFVYVLLDDDAIWLQEGRPILDYLDAGNSTIYRISAPNNEDVDLSLVSYSGWPQIYISYSYETNVSKYRDGPFEKQQNSPYINIRIPSRQELLEKDDTFLPYNKDIPTNLTSDQINDLSDIFVETEIYIMVINDIKKGGNVGANYTISYSAGDLQRYIYDGQILAQSLQPQENITIMYQHFDGDAPAILTLQSNAVGKIVPLDKLKVTTILHKRPTIKDDYNYDKSQIINLNLLGQHSNFVTYGLPNETGTYELTFTNTQTMSPANFSMYINTRDMTLVPLGTQISHILIPNGINYYEIFVPKKGYISFQLIHCAGRLQIGYSQNFDKFMQKEYIQETESSPGQTYVDAIKVKPGILYIALWTTDEDALYNLKANFYEKSSSIPQFKLKAGNDGKISFTRGIDNMAEVIFKPINCTLCNQREKNEARIIYEVFWSQDEELLNVLGKCDLDVFYEHDLNKDVNLIGNYRLRPELDLQSQAEQQQKRTIKSKVFDLNMTQEMDFHYAVPLDNNSADYYLSVRATIKLFPKYGSDLVIFYENVAMPPGHVIYEKDATFYIMISIVGAIVLITSIGICLLCRRYQRVKQIEQYGHPADFDSANSSRDFSISNNSIRDLTKSNDSNSKKNNQQQPYADLAED